MKTLQETVILREFPQINCYRVRLVRKGDRPPEVDIREFVKSERFEGFTRRGIWLRSRLEVEQLRNILTDILAQWPE